LHPITVALFSGSPTIDSGSRKGSPAILASLPSATPDGTIASVRIVGQLIGLFSFDIGFEINLERARVLTEEPAIGETERRRAAPAYLAYATPPLRVRLGEREVRLGESAVSATAIATIHDFGAVTVTLQMPLSCEVAALPNLTASLTSSAPLERVARELLEGLFRRLTPAVTKPELNPFVEDYYVIQVDELDPPAPVQELLAQARGWLAAALRCEASPLSDSEVDDVFRTQLSYYPDDLVVTEWNVAFVLDKAYADVLNVLEYLNVQLVELRFYDALLDRRVGDTHLLTSARPRAIPLLYRPYRHAIDELVAIHLDVTTIFERIHNALKLSGDLYLAKLYARTADRLSLRAWEESVARKLEVLQQMYEVLVQRVTTARAEALEMTVIVLIVIELVVALGGRG
jgi:hypothetical protein